MIITAISNQPSVLETIHLYLTDMDVPHPFFAAIDKNHAHKVLTFNGDAGQVMAIVEQSHPDLLLLDNCIASREDFQLLNRITTRFPNMGVIVLFQQQSPERLIEAMRVGVRETLPTPPDRVALLDAVHRFQQRVKQSGMPSSHGKVMAFIPCKGGSGSTFLATNLAYALAVQENKRVALFDFNLQLGDAALFLSDSRPPTSIADVTRQIHRLDGSFLASSMLEILPNLGILAAPDEPEKATEIRPEHIDPLLQVAIKNYDFIILDLGRRLDAVTIQALDKSDMIFPVLQQTLPFIRDAKRLLDVFHSLGYSDSKTHLLVNRFNKKSEITLNDIENTLSIPVFKTFPNNYEIVEESVNHGVPVIKLAKRSPIAKALEEAGSVLSDNTGQDNRWLKKIFAFS
ncbi:MAG: AAA family ATPase [Nitrosomonas sp.]|nr:AAA family ATPase [Nitrosomonas sp.]